MLKFVKYHGTGNDFILIDNRNQIFHEDQGLISHLCDRHFGVGADGLILIEASHNQTEDFKMVYFNADGKKGTMCGNGGRCAVKFAQSLGIISEKTVFLAPDGIHEALIKGEEISLKMADVPSYRKEQQHYLIHTGSPHYIQFVKNIEEVNVLEEGKKIRYSSTFQPDGINVNFVEWDEPHHKIRTYERGVEAETLSCGTGTVAAAIAIAIEKGTAQSPISMETRGGDLKVHFENDGKVFTEIWLSGPAQEVFTGTLAQ